MLNLHGVSHVYVIGTRALDDDLFVDPARDVWSPQPGVHVFRMR